MSGTLDDLERICQPMLFCHQAAGRAIPNEGNRSKHYFGAF